MASYLVTWEIDVLDADSPEDAARKARATQLDPESIATVFRVVEHDSATAHHVDLTEGEVWPCI